MSAAGWHTDPTGRFTQRWFDGTDWTDQVVGANGRPTEDTLVRSSGLLPPRDDAADPLLPAVPPPPHPRRTSAPLTAPAPTPVLAAVPPARESTPSHATSHPAAGWADRGLVVAGIGWAAVALSLLALAWADGGLDFADLRRASDDASGLSGVDALVQAYVGVVGYLVLAVVALGLVAAGTSRTRRRVGTGPGPARLGVAVAAGIGAVLHLTVVVRVFRGGIEPAPGAWLAVAGYLAAIAGVAVRPSPVAEPAGPFGRG